MRFGNRAEAGRALGGLLTRLRATRPIVAGLPRGGVPVAYEVARALHAPLDVLVVRKLGLPYQPELAMGAIGEDGVRVLNHPVITSCHVTSAELESVEARERTELERRVQLYRTEAPRLPLSGRSVIVVDDGAATGSTALAACAVARAQGAARIVVAVPVGSRDAIEALREVADEVVCLSMPTPLRAVGAAYVDFAPTSDDEVRRLLRAGRAAEGEPVRAASVHGPREHDVLIRAGGTTELSGLLTVPPDARGLVVFAHGSGSSRHSPRNRAVARALQQVGLGTLLFDLLDESEERSRANVFDVGLLVPRLIAATTWVRDQRNCRDLRIGYFGASTGAAAALAAAADPLAGVSAVVSRGGRPDLARGWLPSVHTPTLFIVGELDDVVLELNRRAMTLLGGPSRLEIVPGASHLFGEPGALDQVALLAGEWLLEHLAAPVPLAASR